MILFWFLSIVVFLLGIWSALRYRNGYWKRRGIPFIPATVVVGNFKEVCNFSTPLVEQFRSWYNHPVGKDSPVVGIHLFYRPALLIRDLDLVKAVLLKDFAAFSNRQVNADMHNDMIGGASLFFVKNPAWKTLRARLTPIFTIGKMKQMFGLMLELGGELNKYFLSMPLDEKSQSFEMEFTDVFARSSVDNIASCAFGMRANSLSDPENPFGTSARKMFRSTFYRILEFVSIFFIPALVPWGRFKVFGAESDKFLRDSCHFAMDSRAKSGEVRNDLIDALLTLREEDKDKPFSYTNVAFQGDALVAQIGSFFSAGYETTSTMMSFFLYEMCRNPKIQHRLRMEIKETLEASNGELTYEIVHAMQYLGMVISEVLRMYPPLPFLDRECTVPDHSEGYDLKPYSIDFKIPKGMSVIIASRAIHLDPNYWPRPEVFDPERFSPENKLKIVPYSYLPFGAGNHNCIGGRFGEMQARVGLISFFRNHRVEPSERTPEHPTFEERAIVMHMKGGVHLKVIRDPLLTDLSS